MKLLINLREEILARIFKSETNFWIFLKYFKKLKV